jgi:hypothetical protein
MNEPASIMELRRTLQESTADIDAEVETVAALAVLCQGYLATHAADDGLPVVIPSDELYDTCQAALKAMGWEALCRTMGDCGTRRGDLAQHRSELVKPSYWADVFDHQRPTLTTIAGKLRTSPTAIQRLLDFIWDGDSVRADVQSNPVPALAVAEAYLEMIEILPQIGLPK